MVLGVGLAILASVAHAAWNTVVKRVAADGLAALWAYSLGAVVLVGVAAGAAEAAGHALDVSVHVVLLAAGSTVLHTAYGALIQQAYKRLYLSAVYPISRGLAPVVVALVGIVALRQSLRPLAWAGLLAMASAVALLLAGDRRRAREARASRSVPWGLGIAAMIAAYTTFDGWAVVRMHVDPLSYYAIGATFQLALVTALIGGRVGDGLVQLRRHRGPVAALAVLIPASYLLALYATQHAPVSLVAAVRSSSLIWVALAAPLVLREPMRAHRVAATILAAGALVAIVA